MDQFADLLAPFPLDDFHAKVRGRTWLQVEGDPAKTAPLMSWEELARLLEMDVWTARTLQLVLDRQRVPAEAYCREAQDRSHTGVQKPDAALVQQWLGRGASLLLNEIETLHPAIRAVTVALERALGAKASANLYCSWKGHQAFDSHYDRHDVYAFQVIGRKGWRVYEGRADRPIEHAAFYNVPQAEYDRMKGAVAAEVTMTPGDLLYLPRGQFHDALALDEASVHVTFSCSAPIGLDWLNDLWSAAMQDPLFREDLPLAGPGGAAENPELASHLKALAERFAALASDPDMIERSVQARGRYGLRRTDFELPPKPEAEAPAAAGGMSAGQAAARPAPPRFTVSPGNVRLSRQGADWVLQGGGQPVRLSAGDGQVVQWIAKQQSFDLQGLAGAFPLHDQRRLADIVTGLKQRGVLTRVA
jgi:hypothetical protein